MLFLHQFIFVDLDKMSIDLCEAQNYLQIDLGIEFYLFVSHGGMNDRGSMCKFRNARSKQVEFNPFIYTLSKLSRFGYEISVFSSTGRDQSSLCNTPLSVRPSVRPSVGLSIRKQFLLSHLL